MLTRTREISKEVEDRKALTNLSSTKAKDHHWDSVFLPEIAAASQHQAHMEKCSGPRPVTTSLCDLKQVPAVLWISISPPV